MWGIFPLIASPAFTEDWFDKIAKYNGYVHSDLPMPKLEAYSVLKFTLDKETKVYKAVININKNTEVKDIKIDVTKGDDGINRICLATEARYNGGTEKSVSAETLPEDLDPDTLKASVKAGVLTITAKQSEKPVEKPKVPVAGDEVEYEIEIGF